MTENAHQLAQQIKVSARVHDLKRLAERTAQACREAKRLAKDRELIDRRADDTLPPEHRRLRMMLLGLLLPRRQASGGNGPSGAP